MLADTRSDDPEAANIWSGSIEKMIIQETM
jgi:hypothetical protein